MGPLPEGWKGCPEFANGLIENTFLVFKTPVDTNPTSGFTTNTILGRIKSQQWNLGLWIDLTNTSRYFSCKSVQEQGVKYIKLACVGRESPSISETEQFISTCQAFLNQCPGQVIGVHCTHGFNRTGFLICAYLSRVKGYSAHDALQLFATVRPPGIYRQNIVDDLVTRYGLHGEPAAPNVSSVIVPWKDKRQTETNKSSINGVNDDESLQKMKKLRSRHKRRAQCPIDCRDNYSTSFQSYLASRPEVETLDFAKRSHILNEIKTLAGIPTTHCNCFPRTTLELTDKNFSILQKSDQEYKVSWYPQEYFPYLIYIDVTGHVYVVDHNNVILSVPTLLFPDVTASNKNIYSTILEGFVVLRKQSSTSEVGSFYFEIVDLVALRGINLSTSDVRYRNLCIEAEIIRPRINLRRSEEFLKEPFLVGQKAMWSLQDFGKMQTYNWSSHYTQPQNGLMFYPTRNLPSGGSMPILRWIPPEINSCFFRLHLNECQSSSDNFNPTIHVDDHEQPLGEITMDDKTNLNELNGRIVECEVETEPNDKDQRWKFKRAATNRTYSDPYSIVKCVGEGLVANNVQMKNVFVDYLTSKKVTTRLKPWDSFRYCSSTLNPRYAYNGNYSSHDVYF